MHRRSLAFAGLVGLLVAAVHVPAAEAAGGVRITKIHYAQRGTNLNTEYVVIKNTSSSTVQLKGWEMVSAPSSDNQHFFFPRTSIGAGRTVVLYTGKGSSSPGKRYWGATSPRWDNSGDKAVLRNDSGAVVDTCQYAGGGTTAYC